MRTQIQIKPDPQSFKIGLKEVVGLEKAMREVFQPVVEILKDEIYWKRDTDIVQLSEYKRRDGFIPYSHNGGGLEINEVIPECEECNFSYLKFGEWDGTHYCDEKDTENCECPCGDGEYDALLRIWFKFEGYNKDTGELDFYLYLGGGNGDAPYFRTNYSTDIFEASFSCKSIEGLKRAASKHIKALTKILGGK